MRSEKGEVNQVKESKCVCYPKWMTDVKQRGRAAACTENVVSTLHLGHQLREKKNNNKITPFLNDQVCSSS